MDRKLKIGLVLSKTPSYSETFFVSKILGLQKEGFEVILFVQTKASDFNFCKVVTAPKVYKFNIVLQFLVALSIMVRLLCVPKRLIRYIKLERKEKRSFNQIIKNCFNSSHILTANLDWLHFGFATLALQKEHIAKAIGAKMAVSLRGFDIAIYPLKHPNCYDLLWTQVDKIHTISDDLYQLAIKNGLSPKIRYQKITPAIDTHYFEKKAPIQTNINAPLSILTVARLHWKKGLIDTLKGLAILKENGYVFTYTIVGDGDLREELLYTAYILGLNDSIKLLGKQRPQDVKMLLMHHDLYIQYSISEGFCNAVLEAQAMGLLCVVSDAEGLPENVLHEQTGWVVPKRSPEKLAKQLEAVIKLPVVQKNKITNQAMQRVKTDFNLEQQQEAFINFYTQL